jgi:hypothetical protein
LRFASFDPSRIRIPGWPFPFAEQDRLVIGGGVQAGRRAEIPYPDFIGWAEQAHEFGVRLALGATAGRVV